MADQVGALMTTGIGEFISNRWKEAREHLAQIDSAFVNSVNVWDSLKERGIILPDNLPTPRKRLPIEWYSLLEATVEVLRQMDRINLTVSKLGAAANYREAMYYFDTWVEAMYGLCEKVNRLIEYACGLHSLGRVRVKYREEVEIIKGKIGVVRHGLVHGVAGPETGGKPAIGVTEDKLWEPLVAVGDAVIEEWLLDQSERQPLAWCSQAPTATVQYFQNLGSILKSFEQVIHHARSRTRQ